MQSPDDLDRALLAAHERSDVRQLIILYTMAADQKEEHRQFDAACFFLTQAYVFALEVDAPETAALRERLAHYGRELP